MVIIVDALRGFLEPEFPLYCGYHAREIIPKIKQLLDSTDEPLIFVRDEHTKDDPEFEIFPEHCLRHSKEAQIIPELAHFDGTFVSKKTINAFWLTSLSSFVADHKPKTITVVGVCTDICVLYTVAGLRLRGYHVIVPSACVTSFDQEMHEFGLKHMGKVLGATITS